MAIYSISKFSDGPHWDIALIEAPSQLQAMQKLDEILKDHWDDTVWKVTPMEEWGIREVDSPLAFVLGSGCR